MSPVRPALRNEMDEHCKMAFQVSLEDTLLLLTKFHYINNHPFFSQGVCCLFIPKVGLILFIVFYTLGNICSLAR